MAGLGPGRGGAAGGGGGGDGGGARATEQRRPAGRAWQPVQGEEGRVGSGVLVAFHRRGVWESQGFTLRGLLPAPAFRPSAPRKFCHGGRGSSDVHGGCRAALGGSGRVHAVRSSALLSPLLQEPTCPWSSRRDCVSLS